MSPVTCHLTTPRLPLLWSLKSFGNSAVEGFVINRVQKKHLIKKISSKLSNLLNALLDQFPFFSIQCKTSFFLKNHFCKISGENAKRVHFLCIPWAVKSEFSGPFLFISQRHSATLFFVVIVSYIYVRPMQLILIFTELANSVIESRCPPVCLFFCLWQSKTPSSGGRGDLWSKGVSLILGCNDTFVVCFRFRWLFAFFKLFMFFKPAYCETAYRRNLWGNSTLEKIFTFVAVVPLWIYFHKKSCL